MRRDEHRRHLAYHVLRLHRAGHSQRQIASRLGIARRTVGRLIEDLVQRRQAGETALDREVGPRTPKSSMLDAVDDTLREWLQKDSGLTAVRCHERLMSEKGFGGRYTIVRDRVRRLRDELRPPKPTATPVLTAPGQRAEFDWSPYVLPGAGVKVQLWNATLRWSRAPSLAVSLDYRQTTTLRNLQGSFEEWEGVPLECLTDSMPGVVDRWECDEPVLNARYVDFAAYYAYAALIAPRGCPQWKAVAERLFGYHEKNFLNGRTFRDVPEYAELLEAWRQEKKLDRQHPEDPRTIREMLAIERPHLQPLPARPYDTRDVYIRVVDDYQRVHVDTNHYPVPAPVGARVYVCAGRERLEICDQRARRLVEHERLPAGARIKLDPPHVRRVRYDLDDLVSRLSAWGEPAALFAVGLRDRRRCPGPQLVRLLQLQVDWSIDDLVAAMHHAVAYGCYEVPRLERILSMRFTPRRLEDHLADSTRRRIQELMSANPVIQRPLRYRHADGRQGAGRGELPRPALARYAASSAGALRFARGAGRGSSWVGRVRVSRSCWTSWGGVTPRGTVRPCLPQGPGVTCDCGVRNQKMRVEVVNHTGCRTEDLHALVVACLRHWGASGDREVTVVYARRPFPSGRAQLGRHGREGRAIRLRVPRAPGPEVEAATVLQVARVIEHEVAHTMGVGHRDMRSDLYRCGQEVPWAEGLDLRVGGKATEVSRQAPRTVSGRGGRRAGAGRRRLGVGETAQIGVRLPAELLSTLDRLVVRLGVRDRSEAIRRLIDEASRGAT